MIRCPARIAFLDFWANSASKFQPMHRRRESSDSQRRACWPQRATALTPPIPCCYPSRKLATTKHTYVTASGCVAVACARARAWMVPSVALYAAWWLQHGLPPAGVPRSRGGCWAPQQHRLTCLCPCVALRMLCVPSRARCTDHVWRECCCEQWRDPARCVRRRLHQGVRRPLEERLQHPPAQVARCCEVRCRPGARPL